MKRRAALTALLGTPLLLTGCISGQPGGSGTSGATGDAYRGTVEWWTINLQKNYADYINGMITSYQKKHPGVTIRWVDVPGQDITTKLLAAIAGDKVPDAVNYTSDTTGLFASSMTDLHSLFGRQDLAAYQPSLVKPLTDTKGRLVAVPWYNGGAGLGIYRRSALSGTGFDPAHPPRTWDDALALAQQVHDVHGGYGTNVMAYSPTLQSEGIALLSKDRKKAAFATPQAATILAKYKKYLSSGAIAPGVLGKDNRSYPQNLVNKQIAFGPAETSTNLINIQKNAPDVYADATVTPSVTGRDGHALLISQQVFGIPAASKHKAAAAAWLRYVTSAANQLAFCKIVAIYPSTVATLKDPFFTSITGNTPAEQARRILVRTFPNLTDASLGSGNDQALRDLLDEQVRAYMSGSTSASKALAAAAEQWNAELAKERG